MKRVLVGYVIGSNMCGIDTYLFNLLEMLKDEDYQFDLLTNEINDRLEEVAAQYGCRLIAIPTLKHPVRQYKVMRKICQETKYDIGYFNISEAFNCIGALAAKRCGVKKVIVHSHAAGVDGHSGFKKVVRKIIHLFFRQFFIKNSVTDLFACSSVAAEWMFTKKLIEEKGLKIISNAVEADKYIYNIDIRNKWRNQLNLEENFVFGHVSGFNPVKNIPFLIDILDEARKIDDSIKLLIVGEGADFDIVKEKVKNLQLDDYVVFTGARTEVNELMQAMDVFVFPSVFEGLGIVAIEAQITGLKVYASDRVPKEVKLSEKCQFISLDLTAKEWAEIILEGMDYDRKTTNLSETEYCFDLKKQKTELLELF